MRKFIFKLIVLLVVLCGVATDQIATEAVIAATIEDKPIREMDHFKSSKSWGANIDMWCVNGVVVLIHEKGFMLQLFDVPSFSTQPAQPMKCK
jgi:hypothetical protein